MITNGLYVGVNVGALRQARDAALHIEQMRLATRSRAASDFGISFQVVCEAEERLEQLKRAAYAGTTWLLDAQKALAEHQRTEALVHLGQIAQTIR